MKTTAAGRALCALALSVLLSGPVFAKNLLITITSSPAGAKVEIDGVEKGYTPYSFWVPPGFVKATHTIFSKKLVAPAVLRLSMPGYVTKEVPLAVGPLEWKNLYGVTMANYYLLKSTSFHFELEPAPQITTENSGAAEATSVKEGTSAPTPAPTAQGSQDGGNPQATAPGSKAPGEPAKAGLTNADILAMLKAGIGEDTIVVAIEKGPNQLDTSPAALIELKRQGVPESVMKAMLRASIADSGEKPKE